MIAGLCALVSWAAQAAHTQAHLLLAADTARPGDIVLAGVRLQMDARWHTYWKNPGGSGMATKLEWQLPPGVTAGDTQWPLPEKLPDEDLTTYIYQDDVVLLVPLKLAPDLHPGPLELHATVSWLECEVQCVPGRATLQATLNVGTETKPSKDATLLASWQNKIPKPAAGLSPRAWWEKPATGDSRPLILEWNSPGAASEADFFPDASEDFEVQAATERIPSDAGKIRIRKTVKKLAGDWPAEISGVLVQKSGEARLGYETKLRVESSSAARATASGTVAEPGAAVPTPSLWQMLLYAFLGGLILNVMPCVLPVIALKILGFVGQAKDEPRRVRKLGLIYALGVLVSFLALAALVIGVKAAGHRAGWGMQFGNPQFLVALTVLVTLVALNLFGLFEINPGGRVLNAAGALAGKHGAAGAFFNGVLATILATPCTAPLLGAALGFAFAQTAPIIVLMFLVVGVGLAAPYVLLSWQPAWLKFLPKPGAWMEHFKVAMGFPMLATAMWLFGLIPLYYGNRSWWLAIFLVIVALEAWVYGKFFQRGAVRRGLALGVALVLLVGGYASVMEGRLHWRSPAPVEMAGTGSLKEGPDGVDWQPWSLAAVAKARAEGRPVLVDFTARWCLTCNTIVKPALESSRVRERLTELHAVPLLGDYTRFPDDITAELNRYGRAGVPLVLVYPKNAAEPPIVLPEALTPGIVLNALARAAN
jgi:thiol:disulfide interchange protein